MPHQCTNCGRTFPDGSKEMLSGCPDCGGNKFKFDPGGRAPDRDPAPGSATNSTGVPDSEDVPDSKDGPSSAGGPDSKDVADADPVRSGETTDRASDTSSTGEDPFADYEWPDTASTEPPDAHDKTGPAGQPTVDGSTTGSGADPEESTADTDEPATDPTDADGFEYSSAAERSAASRSSDTPDSQSADTSRRSDGPDSQSPDTSRSPDTATDRPGARSGDRPHADVETASDADGDTENSAQASARSEVVSGAELPDHTGDTTQTSDEAAPADADSAGGDGSELPQTGDPEFERMRKELNEQFESIRIVRPGEYELNLVELYDREEFIISLREDGRYVIEMPDAWDTGAE